MLGFVTGLQLTRDGGGHAVQRGGQRGQLIDLAALACRISAVAIVAGGEVLRGVFQRGNRLQHTGHKLVVGQPLGRNQEQVRTVCEQLAANRIPVVGVG